MSDIAVASGPTAVGTQSYFKALLDQLDVGIAYRTKAVPALMKIWQAWAEDATVDGYLKNLLVEDPGQQASYRTLDAVAALAQLHPSSKNAVIRVMKSKFENQRDGVGRLRPRDIQLLTREIADGTIDLASFSSASLTPADLRDFDLLTEDDEVSSDSSNETHGSLGLYDHPGFLKEFWLLNIQKQLIHYHVEMDLPLVEQLFVSLDQIFDRTGGNEYMMMKILIMKGEDCYASRIVFRADEAAEIKLAAFIDNNLQAATGDEKEGFTLKICVEPVSPRFSFS